MIRPLFWQKPSFINKPETVKNQTSRAKQKIGCRLWLVGIGLMFMGSVFAAVDFDPVAQDGGVECLGDEKEYTCTVTGSEALILTWEVYDSNGDQISGPGVYTSTTPQDSEKIGNFTIEQSSLSPLQSDISYEVQESINSYRIDCEDGSTLERKKYTINIIDANAQFTNISLGDSFNPIQVSWEYSGEPCVAQYNATLTTDNAVVYTGTTNQTELEIPSNITEGRYTLNIVAENTAGHFTSSTPFNFTAELPGTPEVNGTLITGDQQSQLVLNWVLKNNAFPATKHIHIELNNDTHSVNPESSSYTIELTNNGQNSTALVRAENALGYSNFTEVSFSLPTLPTPSSTTLPETSTTAFETLIKTTTTSMMTKATEVTNSMSSTDTPIASNPAVTLNSGSASAIAQVMMVITGVVVALGFVN